MRAWNLLTVLLLVSTNAIAADICPTLSREWSTTDYATRIAAYSCREHMLWYRPFIDRDCRIASSTIMESQASALSDGQTPAWRRVADYWQRSGLLRQMGHLPGASACADPADSGYSALACRGFVTDYPWSAAFISWVMRSAGVPGFRASASHISYVRDAYLRPETSPYQIVEATRARPATGDLLCYVRHSNRLYGYEGLLSVAGAADGGLEMHCDIVVAAGPGNDSTAYLIGGNVHQAVTMRLLPLNRNGEFWGLPQRASVESLCAPDNEAGCNFNRQDWAVLLKLKPAQVLASLPRAPALLPPVAAPAPTCCVNCVVGSGVPRCPPEG